MTLAAARARHADLIDLPVTPEADLRSFEALGHWLMRFSPFVALYPPSSFFLDATGMERLVGSLDEVRRRVAEALAKLRIQAGVAIAPTPGAAWALAAFVGADLCVRPSRSKDQGGHGGADIPVLGGADILALGGADILVCPESESGGCTHPPERIRRSAEHLTSDTGFQPVPDTSPTRTTCTAQASTPNPHPIYHCQPRSPA